MQSWQAELVKVNTRGPKELTIVIVVHCTGRAPICTIKHNTIKDTAAKCKAEDVE